MGVFAKIRGQGCGEGGQGTDWQAILSPRERQASPPRAVAFVTGPLEDRAAHYIGTGGTWEPFKTPRPLPTPLRKSLQVELGLQVFHGSPANTVTRTAVTEGPADPLARTPGLHCAGACVPVPSPLAPEEKSKRAGVLTFNSPSSFQREQLDRTMGRSRGKEQATGSPGRCFCVLLLRHRKVPGWRKSMAPGDRDHGHLTPLRVSQRVCPRSLGSSALCELGPPTKGQGVLWGRGVE